jgi:hypothetical protein
VRRLDTHVLASVSRGIGVREERRIVGEHVLTEASARGAVIFPDAVAVNTYHIDFHWPDRMPNGRAPGSPTCSIRIICRCG